MFWIIDDFNNSQNENKPHHPRYRKYIDNKIPQHNLHESIIYYRLNFDKIRKGCEDKWFGDTIINTNVTPRNIVIDQSEPFHFVQLLYVIKEKSCDCDSWLVFREDELVKWVSLRRKIYFKNKTMFGENFYYQFNSMIKHFIDKYCDIYLRT